MMADIEGSSSAEGSLSADGSASVRVQLHDSWLNHLGDEFDQPYMKSLRQFLVDEKEKGRITYPRGNE